MRISDWSSDVCSSDLPESLTGDSWSQSNVAPHLSKVEPALKTCATNPDGSVLFQKVSTDESIAAALDALFRKDRKSVVTGKSVAVSVDLDGGRRINKKHVTDMQH